jgi:peptidase M48-like protein
MPRFWSFIFSLLAVPAVALQSAAQQSTAAQAQNGPCGMPHFSDIVNEPNMFSEQQEMWLGEIIGQKIIKDYNIIADPENDYLQKLGDRLLAQLPPSQIRYHFTIIDMPQINAFGIPGGNIYISRKIIAFAQNEDELVGLLGHEIGHIVTRQPAIDISHNFQAVLGVNKIGDRKDVYDLWNRYLDSYEKKSFKRDEKREEKEQNIADRIGLYAMTRAGYQPSRYIDFFDRLAQTKGNKGNFWTDLFGTTSRDSKRLRQIVRESTPFAQSCLSPVAAQSQERFQKWQQQVIAAKFASTKEDLPGLIAKVPLNPPLRSDLHSLQFSPDGTYMIAQDESTIFVMTREPLANLFQIEAIDAHTAQFTPDSQFIVFYDKEMRVERWSIAARQRTSIHQVTSARRCLQTRLSPSGEVLACVTPDFDVQLIDVLNDSTLLTRKDFVPRSGIFIFTTSIVGLLEFGPVELVKMSFSPDGQFFLAANGDSSLGYDLHAHAEIKLPHNIKDVLGHAFTFKGPNEIAGYVGLGAQRKIKRLRFPSGETIDEIALHPRGDLGAPVKGDYLLLLHSGRYPVVVLDINTKQAVSASKTPAFAIYDHTFSSETSAGEIAFMSGADNKILQRLRLPESSLTSMRVSEFSTDGKWLAVSGRSRGAVWKLDDGQRMLHIRGFEGACFDQANLIAQFPKHNEDPSTVARLDIVANASENLFTLAEDQSSGTDLISMLLELGKPRSRQYGDLLITVEPEHKNKSDFLHYMLAANDIKTNKKLWERQFQHGLPTFYYSKTGKTVTFVVSNYDNIKAEVKDDPALTARLNNIEGKKDSYLLRVVDAMSGNNLGAVLVDTGKLSFKVRSARAIGDSVMVTDSEDRTLVYSLKSGEQRGKVFGYTRASSADGRKILVDNGKGEADVYDTSNLQSLAHFNFPARVTHAEFSADGSRILILTGEQMVYSLKTPDTQQTTSTK